MRLYLWLEVVDPSLVRENKHEGIKDDLFINLLFVFTLNMDSYQALHVFVLRITFMFVGVEFFTKEYKPIFLKNSTLLLLFQYFTLNMDWVFPLTPFTDFLSIF